MSKFCTSCGTPLPEGARFCASCGSPAPVAPAPAPAPIPEPAPAPAPVFEPAPAPIPEPAPAPAPVFEPAPAPIPEPAPAPAPVFEPVPAPIPEPAPAPIPEPAPAPAPVFEPAPAPQPVYQPTPAPVQEPVYTAPQAAPAYNYQPQQPVYQPAPAPAKKKSVAGPIIAVIAILVVLALAIFVVPWDDIFGGSSGGSGGSGSGSSGGGSSASIEDGIEAFFDVNYYFDLDALDKVAPDAYWDYAEEETSMSLKELKDELEDTFEDTRESAEEMLGKGYTYSFDISDEEELDDEDVEYVAQALEDTYGIDAKDVKAVVCLSIDLVIEGDEDSIDDSTSEAYMVQIGKAWYAVEVDLDGEDTDVEFAADMFLNMVY